MIKIGGSTPPIFICYGRCNGFYSINTVIVKLGTEWKNNTLYRIVRNNQKQKEFSLIV